MLKNLLEKKEQELKEQYKESGKLEERLYQYPIGRLSAYCGAISAGAGAGAGIAYLCGGDYDAVIHPVVNALAVVSGVICDGAKASCACLLYTSRCV